MEAIGRLAGGIAHDFNYVLAVIVSNAEVLPREADAADSARIDLHEINRAGPRAADLTRRLLAFSRQQAPEPRALDVNEFVVGVGGMLARVRVEDVELRTLLAPDLGLVETGAGRLEHVLLNVTVNAGDVVPSSARPTSVTATVGLDESYVRQAKPGKGMQMTQRKPFNWNQTERSPVRPADCSSPR